MADNWVLQGGRRFEFDVNDGRLADVVDPGTGQSLILAGHSTPLWNLAINGVGYEGRVGSPSAGAPVGASSFQLVPVVPHVALDLTWTFNTAPTPFTVRVQVRTNSRVVSLSLTAQAAPGATMVVGDVEFPCVAGITGDVASSALVIPSDAGFLQHGILGLGVPHFSREGGAMYPGLAMQFVAMYSDWGGIYIAAEDGDNNVANPALGMQYGYLKQFLLDGGGGNRDVGATMNSGFSCTIHHFQSDTVGSAPQNSYTHPYNVALAAFQGDWQDAANIYRVWARSQPWCALGPLSQRQDAAWLKDCPFFYYAKGWPLPVPPASILAAGGTKTVSPLSEAATAVRSLLGIKNPIGMHWSGWNGRDSEDTPDWTPRPEVINAPTGTLAGEVAAIRSSPNDMHILAYFGGYGWAIDGNAQFADGTTPPDCNWTSPAGAWANWNIDGAPNALHLQEGPNCRLAYDTDPNSDGIDSSVYYQQVVMCPGAGGWQQRIAHEASRICAFGGDGAYIDQGGFPPAYPCSATTHGHSIRGGTYWHAGYHSASTALRTDATAAGQPDFTISTEGCNEQYIDCYNLFITQYRSAFWLTQTLGSDGGFGGPGFYETICECECPRKPDAPKQQRHFLASEPEPIPLFQYVYHPYTYVYNVALFIYQPIERLRVAYTNMFHEGSILEEADQAEGRNSGAYFNLNPQTQDKQDKINLLVFFVRLRAGLLNYLNLGEMLRRPNVDGGAIASAWQDPTGKVAVMFSNPREVAATARWTAPPGAYSAPRLGRWVVSASTPNDATQPWTQPKPASLGSAQDFTFTLQGTETVIFEWQDILIGWPRLPRLPWPSRPSLKPWPGPDALFQRIRNFFSDR